MGKAVKISGVVITFNEEKNIERCLKSMIGVCDEIIVVDSGSTDKTEAISRNYTELFFTNPWPGFKEQKNFAQSKANYDYVLQLDADEELSETLIDSIKKVKEDWAFDGYSFNRYTNFCGKWINHSGWYPDAKLRLYDKRKGTWKGLDPHPEVVLESTSRSKINGDMLHYSFRTHEELVLKSCTYAKQAAIASQQLNKKSSLFKLVLSPPFRFVNDYLIKKGFLDGFEGFVICKTAAYYTFLKYMYLRLLNSGKEI